MDPTQQTMDAIMAVHKAFGAPGDYGYGTKQGDALLALYQAHDGLANGLEATRTLLSEACALIEEYSNRAQVGHIATECETVAGRIRTFLK